ncbi:hypothetical protein A2917_01155 [Candidatus Nomurabacteria bacterium RIFCSPLOWO2_01_FULL_42_17]|uniref:Uncharacterized protein n=1 Tax=Candidatus Nomurabacteria bacterium RIFCSPLOWO2_01_FULL_42_17 TaxID=1801780 RepID=A0A1F6XPC6_9BACT|nr:MAG: hypothetical protein A2917_01155 [Candidatus Nomurabacteria bacterium RIFCSPLOWO2_01_FULL_42_17]
MENLEQRVKNIEERNKRVEADKAWELSRTRMLFIAVSTYLLIMIFMFLIKDDHPFLNAFIASTGYLLSSTTYKVLKRCWLKNRK